jgi:4-amino-4-deoxy-L-arabinose transferase-like glycosyltransferase
LARFHRGLIYLSFCGTFLLARIVMPEPLVTAFMAGAMFCGICGYEAQSAIGACGSPVSGFSLR